MKIYLTFVEAGKAKSNGPAARVLNEDLLAVFHKCCYFSMCPYMTKELASSFGHLDKNTNLIQVVRMTMT